MPIKSAAIAVACSVLAASAAQAATVHFTATLKGSDEVPSNTTNGHGAVSATLDTDSKTLTYTVNYSGLTGPAVSAHFHGPAVPGTNAPPIITMVTLASLIKGVTKLTPLQIADLSTGKWYFNVHTAAHPTGEIRGN